MYCLKIKFFSNKNRITHEINVISCDLNIISLSKFIRTYKHETAIPHRFRPNAEDQYQTDQKSVSIPSFEILANLRRMFRNRRTRKIPSSTN